jgi:hypothetical protein
MVERLRDSTVSGQPQETVGLFAGHPHGDDVRASGGSVEGPSAVLLFVIVAGFVISPATLAHRRGVAAVSNVSTVRFVFDADVTDGKIARSAHAADRIPKPVVVTAGA